MVHTQLSEILPNFVGFVITRGAFHLRLIEKLGNGAYGVVYVAEDISPHVHGARHYAVKCLLRHPKDSDLACQQDRELANHRLVSDIPNVVTVHAVIEEQFYTFIVLDLCPGGDLFSAIMDRDTYLHNNKAVKRTFIQIVDALAACHEKGVYHRDLKPENVLCSHDDSQVFLADFGLSTRRKHSSNFGCGSSFYMSPECLGIYHKKQPYLTIPSDVWSLGTILCNLITGRNPWHIASPKADQSFRHYLREGPQWLLKNLPISVGAAAILGRIFDLNPLTRITIPQLRDAILALDTFYPEAENSAGVALELAPTRNVEIRDVRRVRFADQEVDITDVPCPSHTPGNRKDSWELRPIELCTTFSTDFMSMPVNDISAAASLTLAGTISSFVNDRRSHTSDDLDDVWSIAAPPPLANSPQNTESTEESTGPVTPETYAADPSGAVPDITLDSPLPASMALPLLEECDITAAAARLKVTGKVDKRKGSMSRLMENMKKIRLRV